MKGKKITIFSFLKKLKSYTFREKLWVGGRWRISYSSRSLILNCWRNVSCFCNLLMDSSYNHKSPPRWPKYGYQNQEIAPMHVCHLILRPHLGFSCNSNSHCTPKRETSELMVRLSFHVLFVCCFFSLISMTLTTFVSY